MTARPPINASRAFARLLGLEVRGYGPFAVIDPSAEDRNLCVAWDLSAQQVAEYLDELDHTLVCASGPCLLIHQCRAQLAHRPTPA